MAKRTAWDLFWARVEPDGDCWIWTGRVNEDGYGRYGGKLAHRTAYELLAGPIPDGLTLDHLCRRRLCCNPDHLEPVTHAENVRRGAWRQRQHCGQGHLFDEANTHWRLRGTWVRECLTCGREHRRLYMQRRRKEATHRQSRTD